jgi:hypothetical protein
MIKIESFSQFIQNEAVNPYEDGSGSRLGMHFTNERVGDNHVIRYTIGNRLSTVRKFEIPHSIVKAGKSALKNHLKGVKIGSIEPGDRSERNLHADEIQHVMNLHDNMKKGVNSA